VARVPNEVEIVITADYLGGPAFNAARRDMMALRGEAALLSKSMGTMAPAFDASKMTSSLVQLRSRIQSLGIADIADINVPYGRIVTQLNILKRFIQQAGISDLLDVNVDSAGITRQIDSIKALTQNVPITYKAIMPPRPDGVLTGTIIPRGVPIPVGGGGGAGAGGWGGHGGGGWRWWGVPGGGGPGGPGGPGGGGGAGGGGFVGGAGGRGGGGGGGGLGGFLGGYFGGGARWGTGGGGGWGWLGGSVSLFGSATHAVGLWHIALDAAAEGAIALGAAAAALGVTLYALSPAAQDIYNHLQAIDTVNGNLGSSIKPLTGGFAALQQQMAPAALEIYGGGLNAVNQQTGMLGGVVKNTTNLLETWTAKIDIWAHSQNALGGILNSGTGYLQQFGSFLGNVGAALVNLIKADPGTIHFLLDIIDGFGKLLNLVTQLPTPILFAAMAIHSIYLWGGLAVTAVRNLVIGLGNMATSLYKAGAAALAFAAENPWVWVIVGAGLIAGLVFEIDQADSHTKSFIATMNNQLSQMNASQAIVQTTIDIGNLNRQIAEVPMRMAALHAASNSNLGKAIPDLLKGFTPNGSIFGSIAKSFGDVGASISDAFGSMRGQADVNAFNGAIVNLTKDQTNLFGETGNLVKQGYSYNQALALMDLAGVKAGDTFSIMRQKVNNLITGYRNMGENAGVLTNSVNAVTFATEQQSSGISNLTGGWDAFIKTVDGGETAFATLLNNLKAVQADSKASGASLNGLSGNSIILRNAFQGTIGYANQLFDAMMSQVSASGLAAKGTAMLTQAGKDLVAHLLPLAKTSGYATAEVYALAQQAGYQGVDSFKGLSQWVGNTVDPMHNLNSIAAKLTIASAGLTKDMNNLANAISGNLTQAMAAAIFQAEGGQKAFDNFANSIIHAHGNSDLLRSSAQALASQLITTTGNTVQAHREFDTFAIKLGLTKTQADNLWASLKKVGQEHENPTVVAHASASGKVTMAQKLQGQNASGYVSFHAAGGKIPGWGGGDILPAMLEPGEAVVDKYRTRKYAKLLGMIGVPGFASGGLVGDALGNAMGGDPTWVSNKVVGFESAALKASMLAAIKNFKTASTMITAGNMSFAGLMNTGAYAALKEVAARAGWTGGLWNDLAQVEMMEAGFNLNATNPSSGAFGMAQFINGPSEYYQYGGNPFTAIGQAIGMVNYVRQRYGNPAAALAHEEAYHWYGDGLNAIVNGPTVIGVGERGPEHVNVTPVGSGTGGAGRVIVDVTGGQDDLKKLIRKWVRIEGGGDVQLAFGTED
jgi:hypothetical protein